MKLTTKIILASTLLFVGARTATADQHGNAYVHSRTNGGQVYIMYHNHMSLYTFDKDEIGKSNCYGGCARKWPPAILAADTPLGENYSLIRRKDGKMQAAFKGQPLYLWSGDKRVGQTSGDGIGDVWHLARPEF